jgi:hypothetical protein
MAGPIRSLDDLARKGFDLNVKCPCGKYERTIPIADVKAAFRAAGRSQEWRTAHRRWRCAWCGSRVDVRLAAYPAAPPEALEVIRQAALPGREPQPSRQAVQDALLALPSNTPLAAIQGFWQAYLDGNDPIPASRASALQSHLTAILRALGRYHDEEAPRLIEWKFGER